MKAALAAALILALVMSYFLFNREATLVEGSLPDSVRDYAGRYRITSKSDPPVFMPFEVELFRDKDAQTVSGVPRIARSDTWKNFMEHGEPVRRWFYSPDHLPIIEWGEWSFYRFTGEGTISANGWNGSVEDIENPDGSGLESKPTPARAQRL